MPVHPYATSHRAAEDIVNTANVSGEIEGIVIRLSNSYGAPAYNEVNCWMLLLNDLCRQAATSSLLTLHSSGLERRDFISLTEVCRVVAHFLSISKENLDNGLFNVAAGWSPTVLEMTKRVAERVYHISGKKTEIVRKESPVDRKTRELNFDISKLLGTGFEPSEDRIVDKEIDALIQFCEINKT